MKEGEGSRRRVYAPGWLWRRRWVLLEESQKVVGLAKASR